MEHDNQDLKLGKHRKAYLHILVRSGNLSEVLFNCLSSVSCFFMASVSSRALAAV